jgi:acyl-CoA synthetase (AMP-forming)/AMP-acid ligase II
MSLAWFFERLEQAGEKTALVWYGRSYSYRWLLERALECGRELQHQHVSAGTVLALLGDYSPDMCGYLLAAIDRGAIVVPLTSGASANRERLLEIAEVETIARLHEAERPEYLRRGTTVRHDLLRKLRSAGEAGLVLFTSGSTGEPKGALHSFPRLLEKYKASRPALRTLAFMHLDHIGGVNTFFHILSNGGTVVTVAERSADAVCAAIAQWRVELLPTTPTFLNLLLLSDAYRRHDLSSLLQITYGTEPMPETTLERLRAILPRVRLSQTYGLSELGILRARSRSSDSLWVELGGDGVETRVVNGILWIRSATAMLGYLNAPSPFDAEGWFNTQDAVEVDGTFFRILGRRSEIINVGGQKVYPTEVENVLLQIPNVRDVLVTGESNPITGQMVAACFNLREPEQDDAFRRRVREHCRTRLLPYQIPSRIEIVTQEQYSSRFKKIRFSGAAAGESASR